MGKKSLQSKIREFAVKAKHKLPRRPCIADAKTRVLGASLVLEEVLEAINGAGVSVRLGDQIVAMAALKLEADQKADLVAFADGIGDGYYTLVFFATLMGLEVEPLFHEVCDNNLLKFGPGHSFREDGKLIKPSDHKPPDILGRLCAQGYQGGSDPFDAGGGPWGGDIEIGDEIAFSPNYDDESAVTGHVVEANWSKDGELVYEIRISFGKNSGSRTTIQPSRGAVTATGVYASWKPLPGVLAVPYYLPPIEGDPSKPYFSLEVLAGQYLEEEVHPEKVWIRFIQDTLLNPKCRSDRTDEKGFMAVYRRVVETNG